MRVRPLLPLALALWVAGAMSACGLRVSERGPEGTSGAPDPDAGSSAVLAGPSDASAPSATVEVGPPPITTGEDAGAPAPPCGLDAIARLPTGYTLASHSLVVDDAAFSGNDFALALDVVSSVSGGPIQLGAFSQDATFALVDSPPAGSVLQSVSRMDATNIYYVVQDSSGATLHASRRSDGVTSTVTVVGDGTLGDFVVLEDTVWLVGVTSSGEALYTVATAGGPPSVPLYVAPPGAHITNLTLDGAILYWGETAGDAGPTGPNAAIRYVPTTQAAAVATYATFSASPGFEIAVAGGSAYFAYPPGAGGASGLFSIAAGSAPALLDPTVSLPLFGNYDLVYQNAAGIHMLLAGGSSTTLLSEPDISAFAVAGGSGKLYYARSDGCFYAQ